MMSAMVTKLVVLAGFLVAFAAGLVTGFQQRPPVATPTAPVRQTSTAPVNRGGAVPGSPNRNLPVPRPPPPASILDRELNLDSEQRTKLEAIWKEVAMLGVREMERKQDELRRDRDDAVRELLEAEVAEQYSLILTEYNEQLTALRTQWWEQYRNGVEQTKAILNPQQRARFEQIMRRNFWNPDRNSRGGRGRGPGGRGAPERNRGEGRGDGRGEGRPEGGGRPEEGDRPDGLD